MRLHAHHAQIGVQGRKGIVGYFGPGRRNCPDQGRLAGIGFAEQTNISQQLQFQPQGTLLSWRTGLGLSGRAVRRALVTCIADTVKTAARYQRSLSMNDQIVQQLIVIILIDQCADWHSYLNVIPFPASAVAAFAILATLRGKPALVAKIRQCIEAGICHQVYTAAIPTVTTVRPAHGNIFLPAETYTAITAVTGFDINRGFVNEFHT